MNPQTVYPVRAGGFPPASFYDFKDALAYCREMQKSYNVGIGVCPAYSFLLHYSL